MKRYIYPAIFEPEDNIYNVSFPDLPGCFTFGEGQDEALRMAEDALRGYLYTSEQDNDEITAASNPSEIDVPSGGFVTLVTAYMDIVYSQMENRAVKKTLTVPKWLAVEADRLHLNYSQVLQNGLKDLVIGR